MAFTVTQIVKSVWGDQRLNTFRVTADNTSGTVATGLPVILDYMISQEAVASAPTMNIPVVKINAGTTGTSTLGTVGLSNCVSGDIYHLWVIGRS